MSETIRPMLAAPESKLEVRDWSEWAVEEKYDGHRMIVYVTGDSAKLFARPRGDGRMIDRTERLAPALVTEIAKLPDGIYDGELMGGDTGTDVSRIDLKDELYLMLFDVLEVEGNSWMAQPYRERRAALEAIFSRIVLRRVKLAVSMPAVSEANVRKVLKGVWKLGGEGVILKRYASPYRPDKRKADCWVKMKRVESAPLIVTGWEPTRGEVLNRGPFAIVKLRDRDRNETSCKTLNDEELAKFNARAATVYSGPDPFAYWANPANQHRHPDFERMLRVEYARRTRTGGYQGPVRWDRWEDE